MSSLTLLNEEQRDVLQEIMNIAMGQAADKLAQLTNTFVTLSVPKVHATHRLDATSLPASLPQGPASIVTRQSFLGKFRGEVFVCFGNGGADQLAELMGYDPLPGVENDELMLDVTNILSGSCIAGLAEQVSAQVTYDAPSILDRGKSFQESLLSHTLRDHQALVLEIRFEIETHQFSCDLLVCITESTVATVIEAIDRLVNDL